MPLLVTIEFNEIIILIVLVNFKITVPIGNEC